MKEKIFIKEPLNEDNRSLFRLYWELKNNQITRTEELILSTMVTVYILTIINLIILWYN